jgi:hypothetical protein
MKKQRRKIFAKNVFKPNIHSWKYQNGTQKTKKKNKNKIKVNLQPNEWWGVF